MFRRLLSFLFVFALPVAAVAQYTPAAQPGVKIRGRSFQELFAAQKVLLSSFCRLDFEGARLQVTGWGRFKPYTSMRANPEFNRIVVVTRFDIDIPEEPSEQLHANYQAVGYYDENEGYTERQMSDRVEFRVQEQNGELLVTDLVPATPHVSPRAAIAWMTQRLADPQTNDVQKAYLKEAVNRLSKYAPQPRPQQQSPTTP